MRKKFFLNAQICDFMATPNGLEPSTSSVTGWRANRLHHRARFGGGNNRARTCDLLLVRQMLSQLSYAPVFRFVVRRTSQRRGLLYTRTPILSSTFFDFFKKLFSTFFRGFTTISTYSINNFRSVFECPQERIHKPYHRTDIPQEKFFLHLRSPPALFCPG